MIDFKHIADAVLSRGIFCCHIAEPTNTIRSDTLLPAELKQQYPDIPWKKSAVFAIFGGITTWVISMQKTIAAVVEHHLPRLENCVKAMLKRYG